MVRASSLWPLKAKDGDVLTIFGGRPPVAEVCEVVGSEDLA